VGFEFKRVREVLQESFVARNKKQGRMFASIKMLKKKIYLSFPEIWDMYDDKRTKKSLIIDKTSLNPTLFPAEVFAEDVHPIASKASKSKDE
jgi:hypothetical protein